MKTHLLTATLLAVACLSFAQSPTPNPNPLPTPSATPTPNAFDALATGVPTPSASPTPSDEQIKLAMQSWHEQMKQLMHEERKQLAFHYMSLGMMFGDDRTGDIKLTAQQKLSTMSAKEKTQVATIEWLLYNVLVLPGKTVDPGGPNPNSTFALPTPAVSGS